jgi:hypothetical protein
MKKILCFLGSFWILSTIYAQVNINPCGTPPVKSAWLKKFQANPALFPINKGGMILPMTFHVVGNDDGTGRKNLNDILDAFCTLNEDYRPTGIQYFIKENPHYIDSTFWNSHTNVVDGGYMMLANKLDSTINVFFCASAAGNAGYNLPFGGVCMASAYTNRGAHTFTHELGHHLSLPHPFLGWEGKTYNYNTPTPTLVTYDYTHFKDSMIVDTTIIDTIEVEYVDRRNCRVAADGFCDTYPDYLSYRWTCNSSQQSPQLQKDPANTDFHAIGSLFMSYSDDACRAGTGFTADQVTAMYGYVQHVRTYLQNQSPPTTIAAITQNSTLVSPVANNTLVNDGTLEFKWNKVPNASHYVVDICIGSSCNSIIYQTTVTDTFLVLNKYLNPRPANVPPYTWKVRAYNSGYTCTVPSTIERFNTINLVGVETTSELPSLLTVYPNPAAKGENINLKLYNPQTANYIISIYSSIGQKINTRYEDVSIGEQTIDLETQTLPSGTYFCTIQNGRQIQTVKLIIL